MGQFIVGQEKQTYYKPTDNEMTYVFIKKKLLCLQDLDVLFYI